MNKKTNTAVSIFQGFLIVLIMLFAATLINQVRSVIKTNNLIYYSETIKSYTQNQIILGISGVEDDGMINYLDDSFEVLLEESKDSKLATILDEDYINNLYKQRDYWQLIKKELAIAKTNGYWNSEIITMYNEYFELSNKTVQYTQEYSKSLLNNIRYLGIWSIVDIIILVGINIIEILKTYSIKNNNIKLEKRANIDERTGLASKGRCDEFFNDHRIMYSDIICVVFDLNNLKKTNDEYGHIAGDELISNFANLLKLTFRTSDFIGRYGGDEFMAVVNGRSLSDIDQIMQRLKHNVESFNQSHRNDNNFVPISYAYGIAVSSEHPKISFKALFEIADKRMYEYKIKNKMSR